MRWLDLSCLPPSLCNLHMVSSMDETFFFNFSDVSFVVYFLSVMV